MLPIKSWLEENKKLLLWALILFLVGITSFSLGYYVNNKFSHAPIIIEKQSDNAVTN
jgi:hypothetical protein